MIPVISQLTELVECTIGYLIIVLAILFDVLCNLIEFLFNFFAILIQLSAKIECFLNFLTAFVFNFVKECLNFVLVQYEIISQCIFFVYNLFDLNIFAQVLSYLFFFLTILYFLHINKNFIITRFNKKKKQKPKLIFKENESLENKIECYENERLMYICCICGDNLRTVLLMPCKHLCMCQFCFNLGYTTTELSSTEDDLFDYTSEGMIEKKTKCPICRSFINNSISIYN